MSNAINQNSSYKTELEKYGAIAFVPSGNSMWPTLKHRAQSVVVESKKERLKRFDVALYFRADGAVVLHRVMQAVDGGYVICGDGQLQLEKVKEDKVFGKMVGFYRKDKYIEVTDSKYIEEVEKWFRRKRYRKLRLKIFYFINAVKKKFRKKDE